MTLECDHDFNPHALRCRKCLKSPEEIRLDALQAVVLALWNRETPRCENDPADNAPRRFVDGVCHCDMCAAGRAVRMLEGG